MCGALMAATLEKNLRPPTQNWSDDYGSRKTQDYRQPMPYRFSLFHDVLFGNVFPVFADKY